LHDTVPIYIAGNKGHVFLCLHGAGHSALSFATLARYVSEDHTLVAFDFRGHGGNLTNNEGNELDLSEATLINDTIEIVKYVSSLFTDSSIIIVGHSMGGAIATKTVAAI